MSALILYLPSLLSPLTPFFPFTLPLPSHSCLSHLTLFSLSVSTSFLSPPCLSLSSHCLSLSSLSLSSSLLSPFTLSLSSHSSVFLISPSSLSFHSVSPPLFPWEGIHLLHRFGFNVLSICDGVSENRKFIQSSAQTFLGYPKVQHVCVNPTNNGPHFFMSDPPHLIKKK
jgi:hypothetical protein